MWYISTNMFTQVGFLFDWVLIFLFCFDRVSLRSSGCPWTHRGPRRLTDGTKGVQYNAWLQRVLKLFYFHIRFCWGKYGFTCLSNSKAYVREVPRLLPALRHTAPISSVTLSSFLKQHVTLKEHFWRTRAHSPELLFTFEKPLKGSNGLFAL